MCKSSASLFAKAWIVLAMLGAEAALAAETGLAPVGEADAVRAAAQEYLAAARRGDVNALRAMWTSAGDYIDASGSVVRARDLLAQRPALDSPPAVRADGAAPNSSLRFVTPEVAIEDGATELATSTDGHRLFGRFTAVWVKRDGKWLLDSLREAAMPSPPTHARLRPLEWLLGEWVGTMDDSVVLASTYWSEGGNFLVRDFIFRGEGREVVSGTERIGWDPVAGEIKSWKFDSKGGTGQARWRNDGDRWVVDSEDVTVDGMKSHTTAVYTPGSSERFVWEVKGEWDAESARATGADLPVLRVEFNRAPE